jgi:hypothetical protein
MHSSRHRFRFSSTSTIPFVTTARISGYACPRRDVHKSYLSTRSEFTIRGISLTAQRAKDQWRRAFNINRTNKECTYLERLSKTGSQQEWPAFSTVTLVRKAQSRRYSTPAVQKSESREVKEGKGQSRQQGVSGKKVESQMPLAQAIHSVGTTKTGLWDRRNPSVDMS